ncbi:MAG: hypothetical protein L7U87_05395 [Chlamydiales bacterium]|nr:hypothetical protein [Chlamydiales bacterium]
MKIESVKKIIAYACLALATCSCSSYKTPFPNDPLFTEQGPNRSKLASSSEQYNQRDNYFFDKTLYQPRENESYDSYRARLINTLTVQKHTKDTLEQSVYKKRESIAFLKKQLSQIRAQHVDLRIKLSMLKGEMNEDSGQDALFARYRLIKGDTLQKVAYQTYGVYNAWLGIYRFNSDRLTYGPDRIEEGTEILIPRARNLFFRRR